MELMTASHQWATRPDDQRYTTLEALHAAVTQRKAESWTAATDTKRVHVLPAPDERTIAVELFDPTRGEPRTVEPTHFAFGQLAQYAGAPASYLRKLPAPLASINLQWGLEAMPLRDDLLILGQTNGANILRALTSTSYGRIWDKQVIEAVQRANRNGMWKVPAASYTTTNPKRATTLYASDRDVFLFLVDPDHPVEVNGEQLFRGFMTWNSEVGAATFGLTTFLYRYICDNRIIWGATQVNELKIRHTGGAPDRFGREGAYYLERYANESTAQTVETIKKAAAFELPPIDDKSKSPWQDWLQKRGFSANLAKIAIDKAKEEEGEAKTLWNIVNGLTAHARGISHTDTRVELETKAGNLLNSISRN